MPVYVMTRMTGPDCTVMCNLINTTTLENSLGIVIQSRHGWIQSLPLGRHW